MAQEDAAHDFDRRTSDVNVQALSVRMQGLEGRLEVLEEQGRRTAPELAKNTEMTGEVHQAVFGVEGEFVGLAGMTKDVHAAVFGTATSPACSSWCKTSATSSRRGAASSGHRPSRERHRQSVRLRIAQPAAFLVGHRDRRRHLHLPEDGQVGIARVARLMELDFDALLQNGNLRAFMRVIRSGETGQTEDAYRMMFGGGLFKAPPWQHPREPITIRGLTSTAAGAYQFLTRTWDEMAKVYGLSDFSPGNQDRAAIGSSRAAALSAT
jgi:hypothetical protein